MFPTQNAEDGQMLMRARHARRGVKARRDDSRRIDYRFLLIIIDEVLIADNAKFCYQSDDFHVDSLHVMRNQFVA